MTESKQHCKPPKPLLLASSDAHKYGLVETARVDQTVLVQLPSSTMDHIKHWRAKVCLNYTKHAVDRMRQYLNCPSIKPYNGQRYIEMTTPEFYFLSDSRNLQRYFHQATLVEIGLNKRHQVCKLSFVLPLHLTSLERNTRVLFFCVTTSGFIITLNICPELKQRRKYHSPVPYLSLNQV